MQHSALLELNLDLAWPHDKLWVGGDFLVHRPQREIFEDLGDDDFLLVLGKLLANTVARTIKNERERERQERRKREERRKRGKEERRRKTKRGRRR